MARDHPPFRSNPGLRAMGGDPDRTRLASAALGASVGGGLRKKGTEVKAWLLLDSSGFAQVVEMGKNAIMLRTGLSARDLRILDPSSSHPSTILGRERAIVINLEHIKAIITAQEVLLLNSRDPSVTPFVDELQRRILRLPQPTNAPEGEGVDIFSLGKARSRAASSENLYQGFSESKGEKQGLDDNIGSKVLRFEFVALEACLESTCANLEIAVKTLEKEANLVLDKLTFEISTLNLERVRQIKSRLVAITSRAQKIKDELEHLLDINEHMVEMCLTENLAQQQLENSSTSSMEDGNNMDDEACPFITDTRLSVEISVDGGGISSNHESDIQDKGEPRDPTHGSLDKNPDVKELEMILESYFVQIDGISNKLSTLREYVDDTEDYINIKLDDKQNHLLQMGVTIKIASLVVGFFLIVVEVFGMNIRIEFYKVSGMTQWLWIFFGNIAGTIVFYWIAIAWFKNKRLLD